MAEYEVWGFTIRQSASGKKIWPNELKAEAARRIREDVQPAGEVAAELGAHEWTCRQYAPIAPNPAPYSANRFWR